MDSPTVFEYTIGEKVAIKISTSPVGTSEIDYMLDPVTINIDSEQTGRRFTFEWNPTGTAGSDDEFSLEDQELYFTLTSSWTAENLFEGRWVMSVAVFNQEDEQDEVGIVILNMIRRPGGPLPTGE